MKKYENIFWLVLCILAFASAMYIILSIGGII